MIRVTCPVRSVAALNYNVYQVILELPAEARNSFLAGQYLKLCLPDGEGSYFSIASRPGLATLELHVQNIPGKLSATRVISHFHEKHEVTIELAYGEACLKEVPDNPLILIAGGTGFAQMKGISEFLLTRKRMAPFWLYWGVRATADLYLPELPHQWAQDHPDFHFFPVISDDPGYHWSGRRGMVHEAVMEDGHDLPSYEVFVSGSPEMVYGVYDALTHLGLPHKHIYSDVFAYAPRD